ncbi:MAG: PilZ domain-containing protein [Bryobacteraceae bacterium]
MERRREDRTHTQEPATLSLLSGVETAFEVWIENRSQSGLAVRAARRLPLSEPVRLETAHEIILGEVCHCAPLAEGFLIGVRAKHSIRHLEVLARLNRSLREEFSPRHGGSNNQVTNPLHDRSNQDS